MIVYDYFLKFADSATAHDVLDPMLANLRLDIDYSIQYDVYVAKQTGNILTDEDGNEYAEVTQVEGYFVNIRTLDHKLDGLDAYFANAQTYQMMFAGDAQFINNVEVSDG